MHGGQPRAAIAVGSGGPLTLGSTAVRAAKVRALPSDTGERPVFRIWRGEAISRGGADFAREFAPLPFMATPTCARASFSLLPPLPALAGPTPVR
jgi:hypothetical protein